MNPARRQQLLWIAFAAALILGIAWTAIPLPDAGKRLDALPARGWQISSREVPLAGAENDIFRGARVIKRLYQVGGQRLVLLVVDGSRQRHAVHDPAYCFRGAGWEPTAAGTLPLPRGAARQVRLSRDGRTVEAVYWFTDGHHQHASPARCWVHQTLRRLTFGAWGAPPVLVMAQPVSGESVRWQDLLQQFPALADF